MNSESVLACPFLQAQCVYIVVCCMEELAGGSGSLWDRCRKDFRYVHVRQRCSREHRCSWVVSFILTWLLLNSDVCLQALPFTDPISPVAGQCTCSSSSPLRPGAFGERKPEVFASNHSFIDIWVTVWRGAPLSDFGFPWPGFNKNLLTSTLKIQMITKF